MTKSKLLIGLVFIIAVILAASGVYVYTNYKLVNGKLVDTNALVHTDLEEAYLDAYHRGDTDAQVEYAEKLRALGVDKNLADLYLAQALVNQGSIDFNEQENANKAINMLNGVLMDDPNNAEALSTLAYAYEMKNDFAKAFEYYDLAVRADPENDYIYTRRGHAYDLAGELDRAEDDYVKALELNPENDGALLNMARLYYRMDEADLAVEYADKVLDISENAYLKATAADLIGQVAIDTSEYDLALEYFNYAIDSNPDFPGAYEHRAYVYLLQSDAKKGAELNALLAKVTLDLNKAAEINPKSSFLFVLRGLEQELLGQKDTAKATYLKALSMVNGDITLGVVEKENMRMEIEGLIAQAK